MLFILALFLLRRDLRGLLAQVTVLAAAWLVTMGWHRHRRYGQVRMLASLVIAATGLWWAWQRTGWGA